MDIVEALAEINRARPAYRLDIGEPDVEPPEEVFEALRRVGDAPYGPSEGLPELREALAGLFGVDRDEVVVVAGGRHGVSALMWAFRKAHITNSFCSSRRFSLILFIIFFRTLIWMNSSI